jgi:hypothetical protein
MRVVVAEAYRRVLVVVILHRLATQGLFGLVAAAQRGMLPWMEPAASHSS